MIKNLLRKARAKKIKAWLTRTSIKPNFLRRIGYAIQNLYFFKVLINRFHPGINPAFFKSLPQDEVKEAFADITPSQDASIAFSWPDRLISRTHYSWLLPAIQALPAGLQKPVINSLPETHIKGIAKILKIQPSKSNLAPHAKAFLLQRLYQAWKPEEALPPEYLPISPLSDLLALSKPELVDLIDLLAMHDLAEAIRHIVGKKHLKALYLCLSPQKQQYLRICLHKKEKLTAPKLDIEKWDGSQSNLLTILHRRGMLRLGKALCGQSRHFLWNIVHTLDTGRGNVVSEYYHESPIPGVTPLLVQQVINVINFLKPKSGA